jgi:hypothetical protein
MDIDKKGQSRAKEITPCSSLSYHMCREFHFGVKWIAFEVACVKKAERPPRRMAAAFQVDGKTSYRSLFQLMRSPSVVVELETGALWLSFL